MSGHSMTTRLKSRSLQSENHEKLDEKWRKPVRLTEDLLYMVNKKLMKIDSSHRLQRAKRYCGLKFLHFFGDPETFDAHVFNEITYRHKPREYLSEESLAVMHIVYFCESSIAIPANDTMKDFHENLVTSILPGNRFMSGEIGDDAPGEFRFVKLPADYSRPKLCVDFFGELTWKEEGSIMVEACRMKTLLSILRISKWLVEPHEPYIFECDYGRIHQVNSNDVLMDCGCSRIYRLLWWGDFFRSLYQQEGIDGPLSIGSANYLACTGLQPQFVRELIDNMSAIHGALIKFLDRLGKGEVKLHQSNQLNMLAAFQLKMLAEKLKDAKECQSRYARFWQSHNARRHR